MCIWILTLLFKSDLYKFDLAIEPLIEIPMYQFHNYISVPYLYISGKVQVLAPVSVLLSY